MLQSHDRPALRPVGAAGLLVILVCLASPARAESELELAALPGVVVIGMTPVPGATIDRDEVPATTRVLGAQDINRTGVPSLTNAIRDNVPSATINDTEGNPFQPDILFRGFTASPVAGTPEGLAVYVNGARFNDAFGDTVNWDLIPPTAIASVNVEASNPLFGLNALGGSVDIRLKNGFTWQGGSATLYGGSYGRKATVLEFGRQWGPWAVYATADATHDDGFRYTSTSNLYRLYAALGWHQGGTELDLGATAAHNRLGNPGATPVEALTANIANIFTAPNVVDNNFFGLNLNGKHSLSESLSVAGAAYFQQFNQSVPNGITAEVGSCNDGSGLLCNSDGSAVTTVGGGSVTDFLNGGVYSGLSVQQLDSHAYGLSGQVAQATSWAGHGNKFVGGLAFDGSDSEFAGVQELGGFDPYSREFIGPGVVQDQPSAGVNPVRVRSRTRFYGLFATDIIEIADRLDLNLAGRYNDAEIDLVDELAGPVNGHHRFGRLNPSAGLTYRWVPTLQLYAGYAETNRAPTPQELSCASAAAPCSLLNFFVGDPNLNQVVARTVEAGLRGQSDEHAHVKYRWNVDYYHTRNTDDIIYEPTLYNPNLAFYTNAGRTLRQGAEANLRITAGDLHVSVGYAYTDATFRTALLLNSGNNPAADANGQEQVLPGSRIPGISKHRATLVVNYDVASYLNIGGSMIAQGNAYRFGDEANLTDPLGGYTVLELTAAFHPNEHVTLFALLTNALDKRYSTYGSFGPVGDVPWPNVPGGVNDPRTASPGMPRAAYGGLRLSF